MRETDETGTLNLCWCYIVAADEKYQDPCYHPTRECCRAGFNDQYRAKTWSNRLVDLKKGDGNGKIITRCQTMLFFREEAFGGSTQKMRPLFNQLWSVSSMLSRCREGERPAYEILHDRVNLSHPSAWTLGLRTLGLKRLWAFLLIKSPAGPHTDNLITTVK